MLDRLSSMASDYVQLMRPYLLLPEKQLDGCVIEAKMFPKMVDHETPIRKVNHFGSVYKNNKCGWPYSCLGGIKELDPSSSGARGRSPLNHLLNGSVDRSSADAHAKLVVELVDFLKKFSHPLARNGRKIDPWGKGDKFQLPF